MPVMQVYFFLGIWTTLVGQFFLRELEKRRTLRLRTEEYREDSRKFARAVSGSIRTPLPFRPLKSKRVA